MATILSWDPDKKHSDRERWICVYPAYINSKKTLGQGRVLVKNKCVENPTGQEIKEVLDNAGLSVLLEPKLYPREQNREARGRIRVQLKNDDGTPVFTQFPDRYSVLEYLGETIPKLKSRQMSKSSSDSGGQQNVNKSKKGKKGKR